MGKVLPTGYTQLRYIESSGTQYLDTGFIPNSNSRVVMDIEVTSKVTTFLFGSRVNNLSDDTSCSFCMPQITGASLRSDYGRSKSPMAISPLQRLNIDMNKNVTTVNGTTVTAENQTFDSVYSLVLLTVSTAGTLDKIRTSAKLYSCQIYDNGTLVRDFIPCINPNGEIGMYDFVNGQFYGNAGTGEFLYGRINRVIMSGIVPQLKKPSTGILASDIAVGSTVKLMEDGSPVEYMVVNQGIPCGSSLYDSSCDGMWLLRKDIYEHRNWHSSAVNDYANSTIHTYLNNDFFALFDSVIQDAIKEVKIPYRAGEGYHTTINSGANGLSTKVFLLSAEEVGAGEHTYAPEEGAKLEYFNIGYGDDAKRIAYLDGTAQMWWLRSPFCWSAQEATQIWAVYVAGSCWSESPTANRTVRPALVLPSNAIFDKETLVFEGVA